MLKTLMWSVLDPLLLKVRSRLNHLDRMHPKDYSEKWRSDAAFDDTVRFHPSTDMTNMGQREDLWIGSYSRVHGALRVLKPGGRLRVGHHCFIGEGTNVWAQPSVEIGNYVLI